jgi:uncharacterized membrane protein
MSGQRFGNRPRCRTVASHPHRLDMAQEILHFQRLMGAQQITRDARQRHIHRIFQISVALKGLHALIEIAGGVALGLFSTDTILKLLYRVGHDDWFTRTFSSNEHHYYVFYLLSHGIANLALVVGLLREKLWAYPATFAVLSLFIAYQMHRFYYVRDAGLIILSVLDLIVMALAWNEYRQVKRGLFAGGRPRR